jgi:SAM-dependent methyltransferase
MELAWSALARKWDSSGAQWNHPVAFRLIELAGLKEKMTVADMGCGTGAVTILAARIVYPARVMAIDSSATMIIQARQRAHYGGIDNVTCFCEDAEKPTLEPRSFDAVLASMVVSYLRSPAIALHAWRDLLRPGGVLAFSWVQSQDQEWQAAYDAVDAFLAPEDRWSAQRRRLTLPEAEGLLPPGMKITTTTEPVTTQYNSAEHWWTSQWTAAPAIAWSHIPAEVHATAKDAAFANLAGLKNRDGSLERTRAVAYTVARLPG